MTITQLSTEDARHIADNPDGVFADDLIAFAAYVGPGDRPAPQAAALWPNKEVEAIEGYTHHLESPTNRVQVAVGLREYCKYKARAMTRRERGYVEEAIRDELLCEMIYDQLPKWARW